MTEFFVISIPQNRLSKKQEIQSSTFCTNILFGFQVLKLLQGDDSEVFNWARSEVSSSEGLNDAEDEESNAENIRSHLNLAMLDVEDDSLSVSSTEQTVDSMSMSTSMEDYWKERWSQSISFD